jgi:hypothetical protein
VEEAMVSRFTKEELEGMKGMEIDFSGEGKIGKGLIHSVLV